MAGETPAFFRIEIAAKGKSDLRRAADDLRSLASEFYQIVAQGNDDETSLVMAHHKARIASRKLRKQ